LLAIPEFPLGIHKGEAPRYKAPPPDCTAENGEALPSNGWWNVFCRPKVVVVRTHE
jgi:hypothetical protein